MPYAYHVTIVDIHDGDTVTVDIDLGFYLTFRTPIRFAGINAPELATAAGKAARAALVAFVAAHPGQWTAVTYKTGVEKYGRWLAKLIAPDGTDMSAWMVASGYAVVFEA
jgi:micrococcal nuclease